MQEAILGRVRLSLAPLVHPLYPMKARKRRARQVIALLDDCAREVRGLASVAADPEASHDVRLAAACWRVETAVEALTDAPSMGQHLRHDNATATEPTGVEPVFAHLHALERALLELAVPLRRPGRIPAGA